MVLVVVKPLRNHLVNELGSQYRYLSKSLSALNLLKQAMQGYR
jgi:hypothetical protein